MLSRHASLIREARLEMLVSAGLLTLGCVVTGAIVRLQPSGTPVIDRAGTAETLLAILEANIGTAAILIAGALTLGLLTAIMLLLVGMCLGTSMSLAVATFGPLQVVQDTWSYTLLEIYGFVLAGAAGLAPLVTVVTREGSIGAGLREARTRTFRLGVSSLVVLFLAATVEATVASVH